MIKDTTSMTGELDITLFGPDGKIKNQMHVNNLVVTSGKYVLANRLVGTSSGVMTKMGIGTGSNDPAAVQTALTASSVEVALSSASATNNVISYSATFGPGAPSTAQAITEAGIFNAANEMLCRTKFLQVNKDTVDTLVINWTITIN